MYLHCLRSFFLEREIIRSYVFALYISVTHFERCIWFFYSSQLYALVSICSTYLGGFHIYFYCARLSLWKLYLFFFFNLITGSLVYIWQYLCFVYVRINRYGVTKCALSEICSLFVHYMIFSESCLEDKSNGKIWNFLTSLPVFDYETILSYEYFNNIYFCMSN